MPPGGGPAARGGMKPPREGLGPMEAGQVLEPSGPAAAAAAGSAAWLAPERLESRALFLPQPCSRGMSASTSAPAAAPLLPCLCCLPGSSSPEGSLCAGGLLLRLSALPAGGEPGCSSSEGLARLRAELGSCCCCGCCCCWWGCMASCEGLQRGRKRMHVSKMRTRAGVSECLSCERKWWLHSSMQSSGCCCAAKGVRTTSMAATCQMQGF